jgi:hypothetical protein
MLFSLSASCGSQKLSAEIKWRACGYSATQIGERNHEYGVPSLPAPRALCVVALRAKVDPGRSVAVLSNRLLAIRMGKAGLQTPVPRVA